MTHEPECPWQQDEGPDICMWCLAISDAYKRGRNDAAKELEAYLTANGTYGVSEDDKDLIDAARGDNQ